MQEDEVIGHPQPSDGQGPLRPARHRHRGAEPDPESQVDPEAEVDPAPSIGERIHAVEAEIAEQAERERAAEAAREAEPAQKAPGKKTAAKKAPTKQVQAKKAAAKKAAAKKAAARKAPAKKAQAPARKAVPALSSSSRTADAPPAIASSAVDVVRGLHRERPPVEASGAQPNPRWVRALIVASVLLLAAAAGLGAASLIEAGSETWRSSAAVRLQPGEAPTVDPQAAVQEGQERFVSRVAITTALVAQAAGVPAGDLREDLEGRAVGDDEVQVTASAAHAWEAERLAGAATDALVPAVTLDQQNAGVRPGDRLSALISRSPTPAERISPSHGRAGLAGGLAAAGVLLIVLLRVAFRRE